MTLSVGFRSNNCHTPYSIDDPLDTWYSFAITATGPVSAFPPEETRFSYSFPSDRQYPRFRWYRIATPFVHGGLRTAIIFARRTGVHGKETGMSTNIYVGNLPFTTNEEEIRGLFSAYGDVESVNLITDRDTGRLRGFGFVSMSSGGNEAISAINQQELGGRSLTVNLAKPREERSQSRW